MKKVLFLMGLALCVFSSAPVFADYTLEDNDAYEDAEEVEDWGGNFDGGSGSTLNE